MKPTVFWSAFLATGSVLAQTEGDRLQREIAALAAPLTIDEALNRAALEHAQELLGDGSPELASLRKSVMKQGSLDAQLLPFAAIGTDPDELASELRAFVRTRVVQRGFTHFGVGVTGSSDGRNVCVGVFVRRLVELGPMPKSTRARELTVRGVLLTTSPVRAYMTVPSGEVEDLEVRVDQRTVEIPIAFQSGSGKYTLEVLVDGPRGPEVAALWSLGYNAPPPDETKRPPPIAVRVEEGRGLVKTEIDRVRKAMGRRPLAEAALLRRAADAHAQRVCETLIAAHVLKEGQGPEARAAAAGYRGKVAENVAVARTLAEAHTNLMDSPSHRRNVLLREARDLGIGVARREAAMPVTSDAQTVAPRLGPATWCLVELFGAQ
ncbi:MAG: hypothetical protein HY791_12135 [Deltaproteobacteria bacterium]|nr:hypothetical protein [Deltaproteobacteria bacterium]